MPWPQVEPQFARGPVLRAGEDEFGYPVQTPTRYRKLTVPHDVILPGT